MAYDVILQMQDLRDSKTSDLAVRQPQRFPCQYHKKYQTYWQDTIRRKSSVDQRLISRQSAHELDSPGAASQTMPGYVDTQYLKLGRF